MAGGAKTFLPSLGPAAQVRVLIFFVLWYIYFMLNQFISQLSILASSGAGLFALAVCCALFFLLGTVFARLALAAGLSKKIAAERADAVKKSRAVLGGLAGEQVAPFLPGFPCNPADARFVGKPVDFVAFSGAADGGEIKEILLVEVKSGEAALSKREREIKACVEAGRVRFVEYRIN